ncbi:MAG: DUF4838 domain-containing protein [Limnochordia bacterium]
MARICRSLKMLGHGSSRQDESRCLFPIVIVMGTVVISLLVGLGIGIAACAGMESRYYLTKDGEPHAVIVKMSFIQHPAVKELNDHIEKATGIRLPVVTRGEAESLPDHILRIVVGLSDSSFFARERGLSVEGEEAFRVVTRDNYLIFLSGDTPDAAYWAVAHFLDHYMGVRWLWPGDVGTYVPRQRTIQVPDIDTTVAQELEMRLLQRDAVIGRLPYAQQQEAGEWFRRHMTGNRSRIRLGHCFSDWWDKYHVDHPDYFAYPPPGYQQLPPDRVKLNVGDPAVADRVVWEWQQAGAPDYWCVGPNDSAGFCISDESRALDDPPNQPVEDIWTGMANLSARYVRFWNSLLEKMRPINPNVVLSSFAYTGYREPPASGIRLHDGMVLGYVHTYWSQDSWKGWQEAGAKLILRPNWWHMGAVAPHLPLHKQGEFFIFARNNGMLGFSFDTLHGYWSTQGPLYYLIARLASRPDLSVEDVLDEYASAFGEAALVIREYLDFWECFTERAAYSPATGNELVQDENGLYETLARTEGFPRQGLRGGWYVIPYLYTDEVLAEASGILERARSLVKEDDEYVYARIQFLLDGLEHLRLTRDVIRHGYEKTRPEGATLGQFRAMRQALVEMREELTTRHVIWGPQANHVESDRSIPTEEARTRGWVIQPLPLDANDSGLLENADFEVLDDTGLPQGWRSAGGTMNVDMELQVGSGPEGRNALKVMDASSDRIYGLRTEHIPIRAGLRYRASVWVKNDPGSQARLFLKFYDEDAREAGSFPVGGRQEAWTRLSVEQNAPDDAVTARIILDTSRANVGTSYFSGPSLKPVE